MNLVCHVMSQDNLSKGHVILSVGAPHDTLREILAGRNFGGSVDSPNSEQFGRIYFSGSRGKFNLAGINFGGSGKNLYLARINFGGFPE